MAFHCVLGHKAECDGCGACQEGRVCAVCDQCGEDVFEGEDVYNMGGVLLHEDCLRDYMRQYLTTAECSE